MSGRGSRPRALLPGGECWGEGAGQAWVPVRNRSGQFKGFGSGRARGQGEMQGLRFQNGQGVRGKSKGFGSGIG